MILDYKGYSAFVEYDEAARIWSGRVTSLFDVIIFQGETEPAARKAFHVSVDDYLKLCEGRGELPEQPGPASPPDA